MLRFAMLQQVKTYLLFFLVICAVLNGSHFLSLSRQSPIDFRNLYLGSRIWLQGGNPYNDAELKNEWKMVCEEDYLTPQTQPGLPRNFLVYPPYALALYAPFALLNWQSAISLHFILIVLCMLVMVISVLRMHTMPGLHVKYQLLVIALVLIAFKGTAHGAIVGQPSFICIAAALLCYVYTQRNKKRYLAVLLLIIASIKPTVALPLWIFLAIHREWRIIFPALAGLFISLCAVMLAYSDIFSIIEAFMDNGKLLQAILYERGPDYPYNYHMISGTQLTIIPEVLIGYHAEWIGALILLAGSVYVYIKRNTTSRLYQLCVLIVTCLLATYHLFYDMMMLLPLVALAGYHAGSKTIWLMLACLPLFIPFNGFLAAFPALQPFSFLYFSLPVSMLLTGIWLLSFETNRLREKA
jgi:hypothetical protein